MIYKPKVNLPISQVRFLPEATQLFGEVYKLVFDKDDIDSNDLRTSMSVYASVDHGCHYLLARPFSKYKISPIAPAFNLLSIDTVNADFSFIDSTSNIEQFCNLLVISEKLQCSGKSFPTDNPFQIADIYKNFKDVSNLSRINNPLINTDWLKEVIHYDFSKFIHIHCVDQ